MFFFQCSVMSRNKSLAVVSSFLCSVPRVYIRAALPAVAAGDWVRHQNAGPPCYLLCHREGEHPGEVWDIQQEKCLFVHSVQTETQSNYFYSAAGDSNNVKRKQNIFSYSKYPQATEVNLAPILKMHMRVSRNMYWSLRSLRQPLF